MFEARPSAKVNLTLEVLGRRPDGYHELRSIFLRVGLTDRLAMAPASTGDTDRLTVTGLPGVPTKGNLVLRALDLLRAHTGIDFPPLEITLDKRIPAAAGLGGGSSDAASALRLARAAWRVPLAPWDETALAARLGSDVPFFVTRYSWFYLDGTMSYDDDVAAGHVTGRGEMVSGLPSIHPGLGVLLVTPPVTLATADVFARLDRIVVEQQTEPVVSNVEVDPHEPAYARPSPSDDLHELFLDEPTTEELLDWARSVPDPNDLWPAAASLEPALPALRDALESSTGRPWLMSGSGPTLFALYASANEAAESGRSLVADRPRVLDKALIHAVDLVGPDPVWRYP